MQRSTDHNASFDYARLIAVIGIIWFHAKAPGMYLGYSGLAFFLMLLVQNALLQTISFRPRLHRAPAWTRYAVGRAQRLLLPWLIASLFYGGFKVLEVLAGSPFAREFTAAMFITGTALHLWFLPFAFLVCIALWPLGRWVRRQPVQIWSWLSLICTGLALVCFAQVQVNDWPVPFAQWAYAAPAVLLGVAFALSRRNVTQTLTLLVVFVLAAWTLDLKIGVLEIAVAGAGVMACLIWPRPMTGMSQMCAKIALWAYLIHPAVMTLIVRGVGVPEGSVGLAVLTILTTFTIVAIWETVAVRRMPERALFS